MPLAAFLLLAMAPVAPAADPWAVPQADIRFTLKLTNKPTHPSAGYFVHLPDGGMLPGPQPVPTVVAPGAKESGQPQPGKVAGEIESFTLWHNKTSGLSLVFADPGAQAGRVHVYLSGWNRTRPWTPESGLTPSAILCVDPTSASLQTARGLARLGTVGATVHARNKAGIPRAPLSIGGDDTGRPRPGSFYLLAHIDVTDPGETWIAPFVLDGDCEVRVDGAKLTPKERIDKWGGTGQYFNLNRGLHRVEVFQTAPGAGPYAAAGNKAGLMFLTWRTPNATMQELGGARSDQVPMSGTSRMETRVLRDKEIVRSGGCQMLGAVTRTGAPAPVARARPTHTFWFDNEEPLVVYELGALTENHPAGSAYTWELPGGGKVEAATLRWVFPGLRDNSVALTAIAGDKRTRAVQPFFGFNTSATRLDNREHRAAFRQALTAMLVHSPTSPDPLESWSPAYWNNLIRTTDTNEGFELLHNLFTARWETARKRLPPAAFAALHDVLLDMLQRRAPAEALAMIDKAHATAPDQARRDALQIRKAEVHLYYLGDREAAARGLAAFTKQEGGLAEMARIRLGDIAFLDGDLNRATTAYAEVQAKARQQRNRAGALVTEELLDRPPARGDARKPPADDEPPGGAAPAAGARWKLGALRDVSNSENVVKLIKDGFWLEARAALHAWEREFPLSKISGDLLLVEARYHMALGDWQRARVMLDAYCRVVDASSFLPDAARLLIECINQSKTPRAEVRKVIETVKKRLEFHPVAAELDEFLETPSRPKP